MREQRESSPFRRPNGKALVAVVLLTVVVVPAASGIGPDLSAGERAWLALVAGGSTGADIGDGTADDARLRWVSGDLASLRVLEDEDEAAAVAGYLEFLAESTAHGDSLGTLLALERLATLDVEARRHEAARPRLERCLKLAAGTGQNLASIYANLKLGLSFTRVREMDRASEHLEIVRAADWAPTRWRGDAALFLSVVARLHMDLETALALREEAYERYTEAAYLPGRARAMHYIGTTYAMRGELTRAMVKLQAAEELARASGSRDVLAGCLGDQAGIRYLTGEFERASEQYREAVELTDDPRRQAYYLTNLASILAFQGRHADALPGYQEALDLVRASGDRRTEPTILLAIGQSRCVLGDTERGLADLDSAAVRAREFGLPLDEAKAYEVKGHALLDEDRLDEAEPLLRDAVARADTLGYFDLQEWSRAGLAEIARRRGDLPEALTLLEQAVAVVQKVRRRSGGSADVQRGYFSQAGRSFDALVGVLFAMHERDPDGGYGERAWDVAQRGRARMLLDLLAEAEVDLRVRAEASYQARETTILEGIAALDERRTAAPDSAATLEAEIRRLESQLTVLEAELRDADPRYADLRYPQPIGLDQLRSTCLQPGEAILEFQLGEHHSHCWLVSLDRFEFHRLPPRADIEKRVRDLLPLLRDPTLTGEVAAWFAEPARAAARMLLDPVLTGLTDVRRLIVVPDGVLHYLPFAALPVVDTTARTYDEMPWLARRVEVVSTPSVSTLARLRAMPPIPADAPPLLLLADPELPRHDEASVFVRAAGAAGLAPVPGAAAEQTTLVDLYGRRARWWSGARATADKLGTDPGPAGAWRSVHLITHGLYNEERPQYSGLVLAPTETDDGFVDVAEIFGLDLVCDQIVLSACSSALGEAVGGEGLVGLVHAFLYAGARDVVAALWDVDGDGGARFMSEYYRRLASEPPASRSSALAAARRSLATNSDRTIGGVPLAHPGVWAAFVSIGDAR